MIPDVISSVLDRLFDPLTLIINHGQRPWYWEGPPEGGRLREVAPVGGVELERSRFLPGTDRGFSVDDEFQAHPMPCESLSKVLTRMGRARRIARSSWGHTAQRPWF